MPSERTEAKRNWLDQHDSLQEELIRLKKEIVRSKEDVLQEIRKDTSPSQQISPVQNMPLGPEAPAIPEARPVEAAPTAKELPPQSAVEVTEPAREPPKERSIRDMLRPASPQPKMEESESAPGAQALPKHPELTNYIAKVMQHESKLKRKKFERERTTKPKAEVVEKRGPEGPKEDAPVPEPTGGREIGPSQDTTSTPVEVTNAPRDPEPVSTEPTPRDPPVEAQTETSPLDVTAPAPEPPTDPGVGPGSPGYEPAPVMHSKPSRSQPRPGKPGRPWPEGHDRRSGERGPTAPTVDESPPKGIVGRLKRLLGRK